MLEHCPYKPKVKGSNPSSVFFFIDEKNLYYYTNIDYLDYILKYSYPIIACIIYIIEDSHKFKKNFIN